jgi:hypothetical protein
MKGKDLDYLAIRVFIHHFSCVVGNLFFAVLFSVDKKMKVIRKSAVQEKREFFFSHFYHFFFFFALTSGVWVLGIGMGMSLLSDFSCVFTLYLR